MKRGTNKSLITEFVLLMAFSVVVAPFLTVEKVNAQEDDSWIALEPMTTARSGLGVAVVGGKIYAIGGQNGDGVLNVNEEYDPVTNQWTSKTSMPTARSDFAIAVFQNKIYVIGGTNGSGIAEGESLPTGVTEVYDPITDTWETKTPMATPRQELEANVVSDKIYLIGGVRYAGGFVHLEFDENDVYDPATDSWTTKAPLPTAVWGYSSAVVDNKIYLIGGGNKTLDGTFPVTLNQIYTPATNTWNLAKDVPKGLWHAAAGATTDVLAPKRIYVLGGSYSEAAYNLTQTYDPETDAWTTGTPMPTSRWSLGVAVIDDELYAIGGKTEGGDFSTVNEKYTPSGYIPEFPSWIILPILIMATLTIILIKKRMHILY
jgi:N-acetylneuraminic acid mutarotase